MDSTSNIIEPQIDNKSNISQSPPINIYRAPIPFSTNQNNNLNKILILIIIVLFLVIVSGGGYFYFSARQRNAPASDIPQPERIPVSITTPIVTDTLSDTDITVVGKYKSIIFSVGEEKGSPVRAQISVPDKWTTEENYTRDSEGFLQGVLKTAFKVKAGNFATLIITNLIDSGGAIPSTLPDNATLISNITKTYLSNSTLNSFPHAIYRIYNQNIGNYNYVTAEKGKYTYRSDNEKLNDANGWNYTEILFDLAYFKQFDSMKIIMPSLTYTGPSDKKEEILALFDKVIQSFKVL
jgi:hypothetical protein